MKEKCRRCFPCIGGLTNLSFGNSHIITCNGFRRRLHILGYPPFDGFGETACQVVDQEIFRYFLGEQHHIPGEQLGKVLLEIGHEQAATVGGNDAADIYLVFLQVIENMAQLQFQIFNVQGIFFLGSRSVNT